MSVQLKKTAYHHRDLRSALIVQAQHFLEEKGSESLSLRELSGSLGVTKAALYRHFKCKNELMLVLASSGFQKMQLYLNQAWWDDYVSIEKIKDICLAYINFALENKNLYQLMFSKEIQSQQCDELHNEGKKAYFVLNHAISRLVRQKQIVSKDSAEYASLIWASLYGVSMFLLETQYIVCNRKKNKIRDLASELLSKVIDIDVLEKK